MSDVITLQRNVLEALLATEKLGETRLSLTTLADAAHVPLDRPTRDAIAGLIGGDLLVCDDEGRVQLTPHGRQRAVWFAEWFAPNPARPATPPQDRYPAALAS